MLRAAAVSELEEPGGFDGREKIIKKKNKKPKTKQKNPNDLL